MIECPYDVRTDPDRKSARSIPTAIARNPAGS